MTAEPASGSVELKVDLTAQTMNLMAGGVVVSTYAVSTSKFGPGEEKNSFKTPRGPHVVRALIGKGLPRGTVFVARRPTGEIWSPGLAARHPERDWILTRILWLSGTQIGKNRLGNVDTMRRFIYIHGTPDPVGMEGSIGCIRMRCEDIIELFDRVRAGTVITIE